MTPDQQFQILSRNVEEMLPERELLDRLREGDRAQRPLRVKQGFDPTASDIHLGHTVGLRKLRQFQDLGHQVVLIIGDVTALVGDPSGRSKSRPRVSRDQIEANAATYLDQFFRVLDPHPEPPRRGVEIHRNGEWFLKMGFVDLLGLAGNFTVSQLLERDDFAKRYESERPIGLHELLYPVMQGYDSVAIQADVELGGTEQKYNLLVGRELQRLNGQPPQIVMMLPVLPGVDGVQRMSKSLGNYIGVSDPPGDMFGKIMSLPDSVMPAFWRLVAEVPQDELAQIESELNDPHKNPMVLKQRLGERIVSLFHGSDAALTARRDFEAQFSRREVPAQLEEFGRETLMRAAADPKRPVVIDYLVAGGICETRSAGRRLVDQKAVRVDDELVGTWNTGVDPEASHVIRAGRKMRRYVPR